MIFDNEYGTFQKKFQCGALENISGDMRMLSDLQLVYMVPRNSTQFRQLLNINTMKFQASLQNYLLSVCMYARLTCAWQYFGTLIFELFFEIIRFYVDNIIFLFLC